MTINQIKKEISKLEIDISELGKKLHKTQSTKVEMELYRQKEILYHFEKILSLSK